MERTRDFKNIGNSLRRATVLAVVAALAVVGFVAAPASAQASLTVPAGATLQLRVDTPINSNRVNVGDVFRATVTDPVVIRGVEAVPSGAVVQGRVISVATAKAWGRPTGATIKLDELVSPSGDTINVIGDLADSNGTPFITVDNVPAGAQLVFRVTRPFTVTSDFFGGNDVIDTQQTVAQAQVTLRDLGYYNGRIDGRLTPVTRSAISAFQRDERIRETGFLDRVTLDRLGLISESGNEVSAVNVVSADARVRNNNGLDVRIVTQGANTLQLFEDHFRRGQTMHIYVRGFRSLGYRGGTDDITVSLTPEEWTGVNRIVVHGSGNDVIIRNTDVVTGDVLSAQQAASLERGISDLLNGYAQTLGVRYNRVTGQLQFNSWNYRENEVELLFALNSLATTSRLYTQLVRTSNDPQAIAGATDVYAQNIRAVDRALDRTKAGRANAVRQGWQRLQPDLQLVLRQARQTGL
jgi:peptidoglycan hydrolase-like protein with peptidoglycan-binding domain